jgi:hypothetical protein
MPLAADAAEGAGCPGFAGGADKKLFLAAFFEQGVIGSGELKGLGARCEKAG